MTVRCSLGHENPDGSLFCDECGEPLSSGAPVAAPAAAQDAGTQTCPSCGAANRVGELFCSNCGSPLSEAAPVAATAAPAAAAPDYNQAPAGASAAPTATAAPALTARLIVEADNQEFDLSGKDNIIIGR